MSLTITRDSLNKRAAVTEISPLSIPDFRGKLVPAFSISGPDRIFIRY
jgi:hypothetical protein